MRVYSLIVIICLTVMTMNAQIIPDDNFREKINEKLGQPSSYEPTIADLNGITGSLNAFFAGISSIEGAQYLINVTTLELFQNQINDISVISNLANLTSLNLSNNQISDISPVSELIDLNYLNLKENQITNLSAVSNLTNLNDLNLEENQINDIFAVSGLSNLTSLYLTDNQISNISAISGLSNLTTLRLSNNDIVNISSVSGLNNLTSLYLADNQISNISAISELTNLTSLLLSYNDIVNISFVSGLNNLTSLNLAANQISEISAVSSLTNLTHLRLNTNQICDISAVSILSNLNYLNVTSNQINDISAISNLINLYYLELSFNQISDIFALVENTGLGLGDDLLLYNNYLSQEAINVHIPILVDRGFHGLYYLSNPNVYAACYPNPSRNALEIQTNTTLEWNGNFPNREVSYDVWLGETIEDLLLVGTGTNINNTLYSFTPNLSENTNYWWRVRAITETDTIWSGLWHFTVGNPVSIDENYSYINSSQILRNFPNPFNPVTTIDFDLPFDITNPIIEIFNIKGERIKHYLLSDSHSSIVWDGTDNSQNQVSSGIYFYRLKSDEGNLITKKMMLLK